MFCRYCGKPNPDNVQFCGNCGKPVLEAPAPQYAPPPQYTPPPQPQYVPPPQPIVQPPPQYAAVPPAPQGMPAATGVSPKSRTTAALLAFFLGTLGIHRFYTGKPGTGVVMLILNIIGAATLTFGFGIFILGAVGIWIFIDFIMILSGKFKDKSGLLINK